MKNRYYLVFWLSQMVSQLGSAMSAYALTLWAYRQTGHAMTVSVLMLCSWLPFVLSSPFAGVLVDRYPKKRLLLIADVIAACGTLCALLLIRAGALRLWHIGVLNALTGGMSAIQTSASAVAVGLLVPSEDLPRTAGLRGFSDAAVGLLAPMLAASIFGCSGLGVVFVCDLLSCCLAIGFLLALRLPEMPSAGPVRTSENIREGFQFLRSMPGLMMIIVYMALVNLLAQVTYGNILSPMLMARSGSAAAAGGVSSMLGFAGIAGGLLVAISRKRKNPMQLIFGATGASFLLGDLLFGAGRSLPVWLAAGFCSSLPIPFIQAGLNTLYYGVIPRTLQGRTFAAINALQTSSIPVGLLLGGVLADYVFEPAMASRTPMARGLSYIVGTGPGSGMAVMFLCTGTLGFLVSVVFSRSRAVQVLGRHV